MAQALSNLPVGAKIKFGRYSVEGESLQDIIWLVVAKSHNCVPAYPTNSITLLTEKLIDARAIDAGEPNNSDGYRQLYGNNQYDISNIDQWLNSDANAGEWYVPRHNADQSPDGSHIYGNTPYAHRPGFLNAFTLKEKNAISSTTIRVFKPAIGNNDSFDDITRKVFLPSVTEIGLPNENGVDEGATWIAFISDNKLAYFTQQAFGYSKSSSKPSYIHSAWGWWTRTRINGNTTNIRVCEQDNRYAYAGAYDGTRGVRPALNVSPTLLVSDGMDSEGCYVAIYNEAPIPPSLITTPYAIYGGKANTISWGIANDPDGDVVTYQLECSINGGEYAQVYSGTSAAYAHLVPFGTSSVSYRVKATDPSGESSAYTTSDTINVINNNAPVISGEDTNLGIKSDDFTGTYTITDANSDTVTVTEAIDGIQIRSLVVTLGETITYGVTENTWLALPNGSHTLTISATDGIDTSVRTIVFTKLVDKFTIQNSTPWHSENMPSRIMIVVTRNIPSAATFTVEVCNNGYDDEPYWEDATDAVRSGLVHVFENEEAENDWGVLIRVTVERNGATGACYVSAIGGNFE